ncbi:MAG: lipid-binding SYLF domain-containing protein [Geminicoccaceae bacterium]
MRSLLASAFLCLVLTACNTVSTSSDPGADAQAIVDDAENVVQRFLASTEANAIQGLLSSAKGVIVYPDIVKAAFFLGGEGGTGLLLGRLDDGSWSSPAFYTFGAASYGLQIGAEQSNVLLIITNDQTLERLAEGGLEFGADASVAAGSEGLKGEISSDQLQDIYSFAEVERGLFAGLNLKGATALPRDGLNAAYYGANVTPREIVIDGSRDNPSAADLKAALASR